MSKTYSTQLVLFRSVNGLRFHGSKHNCDLVRLLRDKMSLSESPVAEDVAMDTVELLRKQLVTMTTKYERSERNLKQLKLLAERAIGDFDLLNVNHNETRTQYEMLQQKLAATESKLRSLEDALEPAVEEFDHLQKRFDMEKCCRTEAEKYASRLMKENKVLKRQSEAFLSNLKLQPMAAPLLDFDEAPEAEISDEGREALTMQIQALEERNKKLEGELESAETLKHAFYEREKYLTGSISDLEKKFAKSQEKTNDLEEQLKKFTRVSQMIWEEFQDAKERSTRESRLKLEAERFAQQMLSERDAIKRESSILLASASADNRLADALLLIEDLTKALRMEQLDRQREVDELREALNALEGKSQRKTIEDLESRLQLAVEESERLYKSAKDMENVLASLEEEKRNLLTQLELCEERLKPPPPPPPPPLPIQTPGFSPLRFFVRKQKKADAQKGSSPQEMFREKNYEQAIKEMMERIKSGQTLRATQPKESNCESGEEKCTAMNDLQLLLSSLKSPRKKANRAMEEAVPTPRGDDLWPGRHQLRADIVDSGLPEDNELLKMFKARGKMFGELQ